MDFVCAIEVDATEQIIIKAANNCILSPIGLRLQTRDSSAEFILSKIEGPQNGHSCVILNKVQDLDRLIQHSITPIPRPVDAPRSSPRHNPPHRAKPFQC